jgi:hypothetical protein
MWPTFFARGINLGIDFREVFRYNYQRIIKQDSQKLCKLMCRSQRRISVSATNQRTYQRPITTSALLRVTLSVTEWVSGI